MKIIALTPLLLLLVACASNVPYEIQRNVTDDADVPVDVVRTLFDDYQGQKVRWGGTIVGVDNKANESWVEVVRKPLNSYGRPVDSDRFMGRFLVRIDGFVDPSIYKEGRELTVYGIVESKVVRQIDEHPYDYPLIGSQTHYLWDEYIRSRYRDPYYYDPYGYYYSPYRYRFHYGFGHGFHHRNHFGFGRFHRGFYW